MKAPDSLGPQRDFVGYGRRPPRMAWPNGCLVAVNLVVCYEEGAEYSIFEGDARNDGWGEYALTAPPGIRDLGTETHFEYGSRVGIWRIARLLEQHGGRMWLKSEAGKGSCFTSTIPLGQPNL